MPVNANNFPMPIVIANQPVASNLSIFDTNFHAVSSYLANVSNQTAGTPYGLANGAYLAYLTTQGGLNLPSNPAIDTQANTSLINVASGGDQLMISANGHEWHFDASYISYSTPSIRLPPYGAVIGDLDVLQSLSMFTPITMAYVALNYNFDQYIWGDANACFMSTNWGSGNTFSGNLSSNWVFDKLGNLTLPAIGGTIQANANVNTVYIQANSNSGAWAFTNANTLIFPDTTTMYGNTIIVTGTYNIQSTGNTLLQTSAAGGAKSWNFVTDGNLVFPDSTTQYTAFTNTAFAKINSAYGQANTAYGQANLAYSAANTAQTSSNTVYGQANAAYNQANAAYLAANNNIIDVFANSGLILANSANLTFNNTATVNAFVIANGSVGANIAFAVNTTINLISANITTANVTTLNVGTITGFANVANATGTIANGIGANTVGYLGVPQNPQTGASYTLTTADQGKHVYVNYSATANITIPANATTSFPIGTTIALITANAATVNIASDTLIWANSGTTGNRSLTANAMASLIKVANTTWYVSGVGLS